MFAVLENVTSGRVFPATTCVLEDGDSVGLVSVKLVWLDMPDECLSSVRDGSAPLDNVLVESCAWSATDSTGKSIVGTASSTTLLSASADTVSGS